MERRSSGFTLVELLVVIGIVALLMSIMLPSLGRAREAANRIKCASNLRQIGQALALYMHDGGGHFIRAHHVVDETTGLVTIDLSNMGREADDMLYPGNSPATAVQPNSVPAAIFRLINRDYLPPEAFICPSGSADPDPAPRIRERSNFTGDELAGPTSRVFAHLSYSIASPYPDREAIGRGYSLDTDVNFKTQIFAVAADINPGVSAGLEPDNVFTVRYNSNSKAMKMGNSNNHQGEGQNVLYMDSHVEFHDTPFSGFGNDNIYTRAVADPVTGDFVYPILNDGTDFDPTKMSPSTKYDSFMLPTDDRTP